MGSASCKAWLFNRRSLEPIRGVTGDAVVQAFTETREQHVSGLTAFRAHDDFVEALVRRMPELLETERQLGHQARRHLRGDDQRGAMAMFDLSSSVGYSGYR